MSPLYALAVTALLAAPQADDSVAAKCEALVGRRFFLRIDVIRIESTIGGKDVTHVHPDGRPYYRGKVGFVFSKAKETDSADDFAAEARADRGGEVRFFRRGAAVTVHSAEPGEEEVSVGITTQSGTKTSVSLQMEKGYTAADFAALFAKAFATNEAELLGADKTVTIKLGMSSEEVMKLKGKPNARVELGAKTILSYADMKLVFLNNKLTDVQ
jgi:hypothetical protein